MPKKKEHEQPRIGSKFEKRFKGKTYKLSVVEKSGKIVYCIGRDTYLSPSAAAKAITGGEVNGWKFWHIE